MAVTIKEVAQKAGVSISTVSKVINNNLSIPQVTRERVQKIMAELNYYPNRLARSFVQQSSFTIGVVMDLDRSGAFLNPYLYEILGGIESVANQNGYLLTLTSSNSLINNKNALDQIIHEKRVDGLIIHVAVFSKTICQKLDAIHFPYIVIGQPDLDSTPSWIDINNKLAGELATSHLVNEGCQRIAFIGGDPKDGISAKRQSGYQNVLQQNNLKLDKNLLKAGEPTMEAGYRLTYELYNLPTPPDGIVCANNFLAFGTLRALNRMERRIPQEVKVIGFDNYPLATYTDPPLSVVDIDVFELGVHAAEALMNKLKNPNLQIQYQILSPTMIVRNSSHEPDPNLSTN